MHKIRHLAHISAWLIVAVATLSAADDQLSFTRPTIGAVFTGAPSNRREVLLDGESYLFVIDSRRLLVYGKRQQRWLWIQQVTTEHGRFGEAPASVSVGWIDGYLVNQDFAPVPLGPYSREPDRIVDVAADGLYRVDFCVCAGLESALTSLWISSADLEAAFRGMLTPIARPRRDDGPAIEVRMNRSLNAVMAVNGGEPVYWSIESGAVQTVEYGKDPAQSSPRKADASIGGKTLQGITIGVAADSQFGRIPAKNGQGIAGVIGADLFERYGVVLDYDDQSMALVSPAALRATDGSQVIAADWRNRVPVIRARITLWDGRTIEPRFVVDTGTLEPLVLRPSFATAHRIVDATSVQALQLGRYSLRAMPVAVRRTNSDDLLDADGTIGSGALRRFLMTFDRARSRIFLRPGALLAIPYDYDASGLRIVANGREFGVGDIVGGYAAPAGVRVFGQTSEPQFRIGDVIVQFDGQSPAGWTLDAMRGAFRADGRSHTLLVRRHGTLVTITYDAPAWQR